MADQIQRVEESRQEILQNTLEVCWKRTTEQYPPQTKMVTQHCFGVPDVKVKFIK